MLPVVVPSHPAVLRAARLDDLPGARLLDAGRADLGRQGAIARPVVRRSDENSVANRPTLSSSPVTKA
jgi:hypothetical protein